MLKDSKRLLLKPMEIVAIVASVLVLLAGLYPYRVISSDLVIFLGRFHPLIVHMPIGFITAVFLLQIVGIFSKSYFRMGIRILLFFTIISAVLSTAAGVLLAMPGGYDEALLEEHRRLGVATSVACIWMFTAHLSKRWGSGVVYAVCLLICMGLVGAAGHLGGALTHGEDYLTAYLPEALGGSPQPEPAHAGSNEDAEVYGRVVQPIFDAKCVACHGPGKNAGGLRMHTLKAVLAGGQHGPSVVPNNTAESPALQRALLPLDAKGHMPPKGRSQLSEAELDVISWWIDMGAPERVALEADLPSDAAITLMENALGFDIAQPELELLAWEDAVRASETLQGNAGLHIRRVALDSSALDVFFEPTTNSIDEQVAELAPIKANITLLDLGNTTFSDATLEQVGTFLNLEQLRLHNTPVTDEGIRHLGKLRRLRKINLYGTEVTDATLETLEALPELKQVVAWETGVSPDAAEAFVRARNPEQKKREIESQIDELEAELRSMHVEVIGVKEETPVPSEAAGELHGDPVAASASTEYSEKYAVGKLYDGNIGLNDIGGPDRQGGDYAGLGRGPHVVHYDMGTNITFNGVLYANRQGGGDKVAQIEFWVADTNAGPAKVDMPILDQAAAYTLTVEESTHGERALKQYGFTNSLSGRHVVMRLTGATNATANPGGFELILGRFPKDVDP